MARIARFDVVVSLIVIIAFAITGVLAWQSAGVRVTTVSPDDGAEDVRVQSQVRATFNAPLDPAAGQSTIEIEPPVSGSTSWEGNTLVFTPDAPFSHLTSYTVTLNSEQTSMAWSFRTAPRRIVYLAPDAEGNDQLVVQDLDGGQPTVLTRTSNGIWDFAVAPDGESVIFAAVRDGGGSDLWRLDLEGGAPEMALDCGVADCAGANWSPDGSRVIYERREELGPPRLWWLQPDTGESVPVFNDDQVLGYAPRFSPDGRWISYFEPLQGIRVYNLEDGRTQLIPSQMGETGAWGPFSDALIATDIRPNGENYTVPLLRVDLATSEVTDLSGPDTDAEDGSAAWSPDGEWIAFGRSIPRVSVGSQLWLMRSDGSEARALTDDFSIHYSQPSWSSDGRLLLFQRFQLGSADAQPGIGVLDLESGQVRDIATPGRFPAWVS